MDKQTLTTWLEIDPAAIANNVTQMERTTSCPVMAVVKANGYGHGMVTVSKAAQQGGAAWLGVARIEDGMRLRQAGVDLPILVLGFTSPLMVEQAAMQNISLTVADPETAKAYAQQMSSSGKVLNLHLKIDTGMGRLGVFAEEGLEITRFLSSLHGLTVEGIFTHFASADEPEKPTTDQQIKRFETLISAIQAAGLRPRWIHASNSAAALYFPRARFDLVRAGIAIYGLHPSSETPLTADFHPALTWKTRLTSIKTLPAGHGVGYNHRYVTSRVERIGVIAVGYADGFRRRLGNFAICGGQRVPVVGGVCMDQCMLQLDNIPNPQIGDEVVLLGRQGSAVITAEEIASAWGTVNYDVVCGLATRIPRLII